jgi:hypothetical protein
MAVAWEEPITILLHGLKATAMAVQVGLLWSILHVVIGTGTPGPVAMGSLHIIRVVSIVLGSDNHIGLLIGCLHRVLVLCVVVLDSGSKVWVILSQL